jgi:hypothetical protein
MNATSEAGSVRDVTGRHNADMTPKKWCYIRSWHVTIAIDNAKILMESARCSGTALGIILLEPSVQSSCRPR